MSNRRKMQLMAAVIGISATAIAVISAKYAFSKSVDEWYRSLTENAK